MGLEMALDFCRRTDSWDSHEQFRWTVETSEPMTKFISSHSHAVLRDLAQRIREGRIVLGALHNSVYTEMMGYETMARLLYTPNRHICDLLDIPPSRTALISDVVGFLHVADLLEADIPISITATRSSTAWPPPRQTVFWESPRQRHQEDASLRSFPYYSPDRLTKYDIREITKLLENRRQSWPYDCLIAEDSYDFSVPQFENVEGIRQWARSSQPV
jgi:hypothetical protein